MSMTEYNFLKDDLTPFAIASQWWGNGEWKEEMSKEEITIENLNDFKGAVWSDPISFMSIHSGNVIKRDKNNEYCIVGNYEYEPTHVSAAEAIAHLLE